MDDGLYRAALVGEQDARALGVLEPAAEELQLHCRFPKSAKPPLGKIFCAELTRSFGWDGAEDWEQIDRRTVLPAALHDALQNTDNALLRRQGDTVSIAVPFGESVPLMAYFCFAQKHSIGGRDYLLFQFDGQGMPQFSE